MSGHGILIIIIPNDTQNPIPKTSDDHPLVHTAELPCELCGASLASRFKHHISPKLNLDDAVWINSSDRQRFFITCFAELGRQSDIILEELRLAEIGIRTGSKVFILPLSFALTSKTLGESRTALTEIDENEPETKTLIPDKGKFRESIRARLTVLQVVNAIRGQTLFSFDFLILTILASIIALLGLFEDNSVILVASMLVSPLMGPILGVVFGLCIGDKSLWKVGLKTELIGLSISICTGFIVGLCTSWSETGWGSSKSFPTNEMRSRGNIHRLWAGALVALPSGAGAALSVLGGNVGSLVGVAISASLLPPAVNSGVLLAYSLLSAVTPTIGRVSPVSMMNRTGLCPKFVNNDYLPIYYCKMSLETLALSGASFLLTLANILCIIIMAMIILRIKEVVPLRTDDEIVQFWHNDIPMVRDQNREVNNETLPNLVHMWKSVNEEIPSPHVELRRQKSADPRLQERNEASIAENLRILHAFARAYQLDLSQVEDRCVRNDIVRRRVQRMAKDLQISMEETKRKQIELCVPQSNFRMRNPFQVQSTYEDLLEVMPTPWREIFEKERASK